MRSMNLKLCAQNQRGHLIWDGGSILQSIEVRVEQCKKMYRIKWDRKSKVLFAGHLWFYILWARDQKKEGKFSSWKYKSRLGWLT